MTGRTAHAAGQGCWQPALGVFASWRVLLARLGVTAPGGGSRAALTSATGHDTTAVVVLVGTRGVYV
jgi:hypothetical protein